MPPSEEAATCAQSPEREPEVMPLMDARPVEAAERLERGGRPFPHRPKPPRSGKRVCA